MNMLSAVKQRLAAFVAWLKGWRTLLFSLLVAGIGVLQSTDWATIVPERYVGPTILAIGLAVAALRVLTTSPVGRS
jgi:hypothetical protein